MNSGLTFVGTFTDIPNAAPIGSVIYVKGIDECYIFDGTTWVQLNAEQNNDKTYKCKYCGTLFIEYPGYNCPNCGAPIE